MLSIQNAKNVSEFHHLIKDLDRYYPDVGAWINKLEVNENTPTLIAKDNEHIVGVVIGKKTPTENKMRCIRVHPDYQNAGVGIKMMDNMLEILEDQEPLCTVSEELFHHYSRIFINRYAFKLSHVDKGLYRAGKLEYIFN